MFYSAGLCSRAGCLGRSIRETEEAIEKAVKAVKVLLFAVLAVGLVFAGEALFGRPELSVPAIVILLIIYEIWRCGGPKQIFAAVREKIRGWAYSPPEADRR